MITVRDLLKLKGSDVWFVKPTDTVLDALQLMADKDVGALVVMDGTKLAGIVSERDFVRSIADTQKCLINAAVDQYMTKKVITVAPDQTIDQCMSLMTLNRIRHLPVLENEKLTGVISIGDVVKATISSRENKIQQLENYIDGRGYGE